MNENILEIITKLSKTDETLWKDKSLVKQEVKITQDSFKTFTKTIDDCCPMCYNDLCDEDKPSLVSCPAVALKVAL